MNIIGLSLRVIRSYYLMNRQQFVSIRGNNFKIVSPGVPHAQGSGLDTFFFTIIINDFPCNLNSKFIQSKRSEGFVTDDYYFPVLFLIFYKVIYLINDKLNRIALSKLIMKNYITGWLNLHFYRTITLLKLSSVNGFYKSIFNKEFLDCEVDIENTV